MALALPELLRSRGLDVLKEGIAVVPVEGVGNIAKWHRLYTALGIKTFCIFDTDADKKGKEATKLSGQRRDIASALDLEGDPAIAATPGDAPLIVEDSYAMMNPNFEGAMVALFGDTWSRLHEEATTFVGESKPLRARYAASRLIGFDYFGTPGERLDALTARILGKATEETPPPEWSAPAAGWLNPTTNDSSAWSTTDSPEWGFDPSATTSAPWEKPQQPDSGSSGGGPAPDPWSWDPQR